MAIFTFTDFLIFTGATQVNEDSYVTIAKGVLGYLKNQYGIYPEIETITHRYFFEANQLSYTPKAFPVTGITSVTYDGNIVDSTTYSYYGEDVLFTTAFADSRIPVIFELAVGYTADTFPEDLQLAIYRHIMAVYHALDKHTDNIDKSVNSDGNTSYFSSNVVPPACKQTYEFYAGSTLVVF